jgi:tRNA (guanine37-N1)-methyltransferase
LVVVEAVTRLLPGVVGNPESPRTESFQPTDMFRGGLLEGPQYTRPARFRDLEVPEVLRSGHHAEIQRWRSAQALARTEKRRPDLLKGRNGEAKS